MYSVDKAFSKNAQEVLEVGFEVIFGGNEALAVILF